MNTISSAGFKISFQNPKELGRYIKQLRSLRYMTQRDLAMMTGTSEKFISNVENGKENAQIGKVLLLIRVLDAELCLCDLNGSAL